MARYSPEMWRLAGSTRHAGRRANSWLALSLGVVSLVTALAAHAEYAPSSDTALKEDVLHAVRDADRAPVSDNLARVLGPTAVSQGTPTFDYSALAREAGDRNRYNDALDTGDAFDRERTDDAQGESLHATLSVEAGTGGLMRTRAAVTVPLLDNELTIRITAEKGNNTGYRFDHSDLRDGRFVLDPHARLRDRDRDRDRSSVGFDLRWTPSDAFGGDHLQSPNSTR